MRRSDATFRKQVTSTGLQDLTPTSSDGHVKEIPGFYYDATKKRYFKVSREHPKSPQIECHHKDEPGCCTLLVYRKEPHNFVVKCILERQCYANHPVKFRRKILEKLVKQMKLRQSMHLNPFLTSDARHTCVSLARIESDLMTEKILTTFSLPGYTPADANIVLFSEVRKDDNNQVSLRANSSMLRTQKTTAISWSPHKKSCNFYVLSSLGSGSCSGEVSLFQIMGCSQKFTAKFPVHSRSVWTTEWNRNPLYRDIISVGASKAGIVFDVNTKRLLTVINSFSDVLAQEFAVRSPILFSGQRGGWLVGHDLRSKAALTSLRIRHARLASITCIRLMNDENYMVSSALDGTIKRWDLRMHLCVQEYRGHVNSITHCLPFYMDSTDTFLYAGGEDTVTRVWSVQSGEVIRTIPFPENAVKTMSDIPALSYAEEWGGPGGFPGLMYGTSDTVSMYRF